MDSPILIISLAALVAIAIVTTALLIGWRSWIALKATELARSSERDPLARAINTRIELADLRERLRKLEAIAAGIEL